MKRLLVVALLAAFGAALWPRGRHHASPSRAEIRAVSETPSVALEPPAVAPIPAPPRTRYVEVTLRRDRAEAGSIALAELGARCVQEIDDVSGVYAVPEDRLDDVGSHPDVASVAVQDAGRKVSYEAGLHLRSVGYEGGYLAAFHDGVPAEDALAAIARAGLATSDARYRDGTSILVTGPPEAVEALLVDERLSQLWPTNPPVCTHNSFAAAQSKVNQIQAATIYGLTGQGVTLAMWDLGAPRVAHVEFGGRLTAQAGTQSTHATHVAGTLIASGQLTVARGMSPAASLRSFVVVNDDTTSYGQWYAQRANYVACNNSWGYETGWSGVWWYGSPFATLDVKFGKYTLVSRNADDATEDDDVIAVVSAGNERDDTATRGAHFHLGYPNQLFTDQHGADFQNAGGYDTLPPSATAKNPIVVGAADGTGMSSFSSWGACDDGRMKPDLVAHGVNVFSTSDDASAPYTWGSGTSMSAPVVTGTIGLLTQYMRGRQLPASGKPRLSMMKALLCHTATDLGPPGPDYRHGYGLLDARKAADYLLWDSGRAFKHLRVISVTQGATQTIQMYVYAGQRVKVTMAWADRAGVANIGGNDDATRALVRDLDLRIVGPTGVTYSPFVLSRQYPGFTATTGNNNVDPIEQVLIYSAPTTGWYQARVTFAGATNPSVSQAFSIVLSHSDAGVISTNP